MTDSSESSTETSLQALTEAERGLFENLIETFSDSLLYENVRLAVLRVEYEGKSHAAVVRVHTLTNGEHDVYPLALLVTDEMMDKMPRPDGQVV